MESSNLELGRENQTRKIIEIDEEKCDGCGLCIPNCAEGALQIVDGKARLVSDIYCDGLGACLGHCPQGAMEIIEREAPAFDEEAVHEHLKSLEQQPVTCPSVSPLNLEAGTPQPTHRESALRHWPVQLRLVPPEAPRFEDGDLLVVADCVPVAHPDFHGSLLPGRAVVMGCPKLDDIASHGEKLKEIFKRNDVRSVTVAMMEVPCCSGLGKVVDYAIEAAGKPIPVRKHIIKVGGEMR
ncbi:MAG: 4Fe-4S binding protein [Candidatus Bathyarchaeota archaeon]|jgi:ferredoxin